MNKGIIALVRNVEMDWKNSIIFTIITIITNFSSNKAALLRCVASPLTRFANTYDIAVRLLDVLTRLNLRQSKKVLRA
jgi:hypothetical protein